MTNKHPPPLTKTQRRRIKQLAARNTAPVIAERLGLPVSRVRRFCVKAGIAPKRATHAPLGDIKSIEAEIIKFGSVQAVADHYSVTRQAVHWRLNQ